MKAAHSAASVPTRIQTGLSVNTITTVATTARISSTPRAMLARPRSSPRPGRAGLGLSVEPSELMSRMIAPESLVTQVTEVCWSELSPGRPGDRV